MPDFRVVEHVLPPPNRRNMKVEFGGECVHKSEGVWKWSYEHVLMNQLQSEPGEWRGNRGRRRQDGGTEPPTT